MRRPKQILSAIKQAIIRIVDFYTLTFDIIHINAVEYAGVIENAVTCGRTGARARICPGRAVERRTMKVILFASVLFAISAIAVTCFSATQYTNDGTWSSKMEVQRWLINRDRYAPESGADLLGLVNTNSGGSPDYDCCEDTVEPNDFGANSADWAPWKASKPPLAPNAILTITANKHSLDMCEQDTLDHYSPSTNYYPLDSEPYQRAELEGYTNEISGYYENIGMGWQSGGSYPPYGQTSESFHEDLFIDTSSTNRGHRQAILNSDAREIGLGHRLLNIYTNSEYRTYDWFTQDFGRRYDHHFFTGTIFYDSNSDKAYTDGEGISNVEIHLWNGSIEAAYYDVSPASGSFAIPIADLTAGKEISVQLVNRSGGPIDISIPMGWGTLGEIHLTNNEAYIYGTFTQPDTDVNVGFRDTDPKVKNIGVSVSGGIAEVSFSTFKGATYKVYHNTDLANGSWSNLTQVTATGTVYMLNDLSVTNDSRKFYQTYLIRE